MAKPSAAFWFTIVAILAQIAVLCGTVYLLLGGTGSVAHKNDLPRNPRGYVVIVGKIKTLHNNY